MKDFELHPSIVDRLNEYADCGYAVDETSITVSGTKNKYAANAQKLAKAIQQSFTLRVVGNKLYLYTDSTPCYRLVPDPVEFIFQSLHEEQLDLFRLRDIEEVAKRVLLSKSLSTAEDAFNADPHLINVSNGVWDARTGSLSEHSHKRLFTYCIQANFYRQHSYHHPSFDEFCRTSLDGDPMKKLLFLEILGVLLSDHPAKAAFFLLGASNTGKSVIINFISKLVGRELISSVPLHKLGNRFNIAELWGKKLNIVGEIKGKKLSDITTFKAVTGSDRVQAERKGKDPFTFIPRAKLLFAGNVLPKTTESDGTDAFANRIIPLLFNTSIAPENQDPILSQKLWDERNAIVSEALNAFRSWLNRGRQWSLPAESIRYVNKFRSNVQSDKMFIEECCEKGDSFFVSNANLKTAYRQWCEINGFTPVSVDDLYASLDNLPNVERGREYDEDGHRPHGRKGIKLKRQVGHLVKFP